MFTNISWNEYALIIAAAFFLYYAWIFFIFYAKNMLGIFSRNKIFATRKQENENQSEEIFGVVYRLQDEVKETIAEAADRNSPKEELIFSLRTVLNKYALQSTPFQFAINNFIDRQCEHNCSIHLSEEDLKQLWG